MKFNLVIDIADADIAEAMEINACTKQEAVDRITNNLYMGASCIDAMLHRSMGIDGTDSYVEREIANA